MLPAVVLVLGNALTTEPDVDVRLAWPREVELALSSWVVKGIAETLWGRSSFSTLLAVGSEASELLGEVRVVSFGGDLAHPFEIGRGWWCGAPTRIIHPSQ